MSETANLHAEQRTRLGKGAARALRRAGRVPAVVYGGGGEPLHVAVSRREIVRAYDGPGFFTRLYDLTVNGETLRVLPREVALDPVTDEPIHADFLRYEAGKKVRISVSVNFVGQEECPGLRRGGVLNVVRHEVELVCPVDAIPDELTVDLTGREIGDSFHISHVALPEGVSPAITDRDFTIATIAAPTVQAEEVAAAEEAEEAAAAEEEAAAEEGEAKPEAGEE